MKNQKARIGVLILLAAAALLAAVYYFARPQPVAGAKTVTVEVIHGDGSISEELGVEGENGPYGLYIQTVDGETASDADRTYWSLSKDGEITPNGADLTPIADGERYELTLTKGSW